MKDPEVGTPLFDLTMDDVMMHVIVKIIVNDI